MPTKLIRQTVEWTFTDDEFVDILLAHLDKRGDLDADAIIDARLEDGTLIVSVELNQDLEPF